MNDDPLVLILPLVRPGGGELDGWLGDSLARTLRRRLEATGRRVVPLDAATHACESLGIEPGEDALPESKREWLATQTGATHLVQGRFERADQKLSLQLEVTPCREGATTRSVSARGPEADFQEVIDDAVVRLIQHVPGATGEHVRGRLRGARTTESLDAYLAVVRARQAWDQGDEQRFEDEVAAAIRLDPGFVEPHEVVAGAAREAGDTDRQVESLLEVARVHGEAGRRHEQAKALLSVGYARVETGEWDEAIAAYEEAAERFDAEGEVRGAVQARMNVANVHLRLGDAQRAIDEYQRGLERIRVFPEDYAKHVFNLGLALKETGELEAAVGRLEEARGLGFQLRDEELISSCYNALGAVYDDLGDDDKALSNFRRAEEHLDAKADPVLLAGVKDNIGIILKKQGQRELALGYSEQACELLESRGTPLHVAIAYVNRAGLLLELGRPDEAAPFAVAAHREFVRLNSRSRETTAKMLEELEFDAEAVALIEREAEAEDYEDEDPGDDEDLDELDLDEDESESESGEESDDELEELDSDDELD
ncbi:MAG: tetratricopeptide repeat protein [Planctomycetota bacterium]